MDQYWNNIIGLKQKFVAFFSSKISIFYKISMTPILIEQVSAFRIYFIKLRYDDLMEL